VIGDIVELLVLLTPHVYEQMYSVGSASLMYATDVLHSND